MDPMASDQRHVLPGMRGTARRTRDRPPGDGERAQPTTRRSTPSSAPCIRSRAAPARSSSIGSSSFAHVFETDARPHPQRPAHACAAGDEVDAARRRRARRSRHAPRATAELDDDSRSKELIAELSAHCEDRSEPAAILPRRRRPPRTIRLASSRSAVARSGSRSTLSLERRRRRIAHRLQAQARALRQGQRDDAAAARTGAARRADRALRDRRRCRCSPIWSPSSPISPGARPRQRAGPRAESRRCSNSSTAIAISTSRPSRCAEAAEGRTTTASNSTPLAIAPPAIEAAAPAESPRAAPPKAEAAEARGRRRRRRRRPPRTRSASISTASTG